MALSATRGNKHNRFQGRKIHVLEESPRAKIFLINFHSNIRNDGRQIFFEMNSASNFSHVCAAMKTKATLVKAILNAAGQRHLARSPFDKGHSITEIAT